MVVIETSPAGWSSYWCQSWSGVGPEAAPPLLLLLIEMNFYALIRLRKH